MNPLNPLSSLHPVHQLETLQTRRRFLKFSAMGLGAAVFGSMPVKGSGLTTVRGTHFTPKAKRVIFLFMAGAPSQLDLFDYKPDLHKQFNQPLPKSVSMGQRVTAMTKGRDQIVAPSMFSFSPRGQNGVYMSELLPHLSNVVDDLCIIKSTHTDAINHDPAKTMFCTGSQIPGKASMGSWLSYGLGSMNKNLPDFMVLNSAFWTGGHGQCAGAVQSFVGFGISSLQASGCFLATRGRSGAFPFKSKWRESRRAQEDAGFGHSTESAAP